MKKKDAVKLLERMNESKMNMYRIAEQDGDKDLAMTKLHESIMLDTVLWILTKDEIAQKFWDIYFEEVIE